MAQPSPAQMVLIERVIERDPEAYRTLLAPFYARLWSVCVAFAGHRDRAWEMLRQAAASCFRRAAGFNGQTGVFSWIADRALWLYCQREHDPEPESRRHPIEDHGRVLEHLASLAAGQLSREPVADHLAECRSCAEALARAEQALAVTLQTPDRPFDVFWDALDLSS